MKRSAQLQERRAGRRLRPLVIVDRDGVINVNRSDHVKSWDEFEFLPKAVASLARLTSQGFPLVVISNQAVVGRGLVDRDVVDAIHDRMLGVLARGGVRVLGVFICPHRPEDGCDCRKPKPGLIFQAQALLPKATRSCYVIGDHLDDIEAGQRAGAETILVLTGRGSGCLHLIEDRGVEPDHVVANVSAAADLILAAHATQRARPLAEMPGSPVPTGRRHEQVRTA